MSTSSGGTSGRSGILSVGGSEVFAFSNAYPKIKQTIFAPVQPSAAVHPQNRDFLQDYILNPRRKPEIHVLRQLTESAQLRYSFVCNVVVAVCNEVDNDRLNDIALLCAELTAGCSALSAEWLGVLTALCYSASTYIDVLTQVDVQVGSIKKLLIDLFRSRFIYLFIYIVPFLKEGSAEFSCIIFTLLLIIIIILKNKKKNR